MPLTYPFGALRKISEQRYPDLTTAVNRLVSEGCDNESLTAQSVRVQLEGLGELTDALVQRIAEDLDAQDSTQWLRTTLTTPTDSDHDYLNSIENLRELALSGATFRRLR